MNRREFLKRMLATTAVAATATVVSPIVRGLVEQGFMESPFILYGDGFHDDTAALQAYIDGKPIKFNGRELKRERLSNGDFVVNFPPGEFKISQAIELKPEIREIKFSRGAYLNIQALA